MNSQNFKYLDNLIKASSKEIVLDADIILDDEEELKYAYGIRIERDDLIINGKGHFIDAKTKARIFSISSNNIILKNIKFKNAYSYEEGSAISHEGGDLKILDCEFKDNYSFENGGAIVCGWNSNLKIINTNFIENHAVEGGAICNYNGKISISKSKFKKNSSQKSGGSIANLGYGILESDKTCFKDNHADKNGGAIINFGELNLKICEFHCNSTRNDGGAINNQRDANLKIADSTFKSNEAEKYGGAIINYGKTDLKNSKFEKNSTINDGGAISNQKIGSMNITNAKFSQNHAEIVGGAIINFGDICLKDSRFDANITSLSGGAINNQTGDLIIINTVFTKNSSQKNGGAIINWKKLNIKDSRFENNSSDGDGGAIICKEGSNNIISTTDFVKNHALAGCCISNYSKNLNIVNSRFLKHDSNNIILNKNALNLFNPIFNGNSSKNIIINDENSKLSLSGGKFIRNSCDETCIRNIGRYCSVSKTVFKSNTSDNKFCENIINEGNLSLTEPKFNPKRKTILNSGHVEARKIALKEIEKIIENIQNGSIDTFEIPDEFKNDFSHLNRLIRKNKYVKLTDDITLENYELDFFEGGIDLDIDNLVIDGAGRSIDAKSKTRIFTVTGKNITLKNINFKNASAFSEFDEHTTGGGTIRCIKGSSLNLEKCTFENSYCDGDGGAILNNGDLISTASTFKKSTSKHFGGAICNKNNLTINDDKFKSSNSRIGGAIYNAGILRIERGPELTDNTSHYSKDIYNANIVNAPNKNTEESILNTGEINPEKKDTETFTYLNNRIENSERIELTKDIIYDYCKDDGLKNGITIEKDMIIDGKGHFIDAKNSSALFNVKKSLTLKNITIKNCYSQDNAIIQNRGKLILENCRFQNNKTARDTSLIDNNTHLKITACLFLNNFTKKSLINNKGKLDLVKSDFINSDSQTSGAVIHNINEITLSNCNFKSNKTNDRGGVFNNVENATIRISHSNFSNNISIIGGGVLFNFGKITIENSKIIRNVSHNNGGGLNNQITGIIDVKNTEFIENKACSGGAIWTCHKTDLNLKDCTFKGNSPNDIVEN